MDADLSEEPVIHVDEVEPIPTSHTDPNPAVASLRAQAGDQNSFDLQGATRSSPGSASINGLCLKWFHHHFAYVSSIFARPVCML